MFINFYDPHRNSPFYNMVISLIFTQRDQFYQALYNAISKNPTYVILSDLDIDKKVKIISDMIEYYESKEAYEKCAKLLDIKKGIEEYVENPSR